MASLYLKVSFVPPGEAPAWVREKWVGLRLPLAQNTQNAKSFRVAGVLTGPRSLRALLAALFAGGFRRVEGYVVDAPAALAILESAHPEAAAWWREHVPHSFLPGGKFVFPKGIGDVVP